jgi:ferredoxin-type protein NapH
VQLMAAWRRIIPGLLLAGMLGFGLIVLFGRAFCGWICPGRWIFNRGPTANSKPWKYRAWAQRIIVGGVLAAAYVCHNPIFCTICPAGVVCRGAIAAGTGGSILPTFGWMGALQGLEWASGRSFCRDLCPMGAWLSRLSRLNPFFRLKSNPTTCHPCIACQRVCPEDLNLAKDSNLSSCTKCMQCLTTCPRGAVEIKVL